VSGDAAAALARLDEITRRLRVECPWDREQDERSIVPHTVEEAYELADAAAQGDDSKMIDELGDVLFQVHFLSLLLEERGAGSLAEVAEGMTAKLIRRHPHVFATDEGSGMATDEGSGMATDEGSDPSRSGLSAGGPKTGSDPSGPTTSREVLTQWDQIKREVEGRGADDPFADVPENLPGLLYARKVLRRAAPDAGSPPPKDPEARERAERWLGEVLLELVGISRRLGVDPELAVRAAAGRARDQAREAAD
jgi:XTP/dITP diphosphohydrolase/tetrapyrrole methylase family protein/MazG family protein/ATP diphosphatase